MGRFGIRRRRRAWIDRTKVAYTKVMRHEDCGRDEVDAERFAHGGRHLEPRDLVYPDRILAGGQTGKAVVPRRAGDRLRLNGIQEAVVVKVYEDGEACVSRLRFGRVVCLVADAIVVEVIEDDTV